MLPCNRQRKAADCTHKAHGWATPNCSDSGEKFVSMETGGKMGAMGAAVDASDLRRVRKQCKQGVIGNLMPHHNSRGQGPTDRAGCGRLAASFPSIETETARSLEPESNQNHESP